jgi:hypothetical protein
MKNHPDHCYCGECKRALMKWDREHGTYIYTPDGMLVAMGTRETEQEWLDKGFLVAYMRLSLPEPFEFEIVT